MRNREIVGCIDSKLYRQIRWLTSVRPVSEKASRTLPMWLQLETTIIVSMGRKHLVDSAIQTRMKAG